MVLLKKIGLLVYLTILTFSISIKAQDTLFRIYPSISQKEPELNNYIQPFPNGDYGIIKQAEGLEFVIINHVGEIKAQINIPELNGYLLRASELIFLNANYWYIIGVGKNEKGYTLLSIRCDTTLLEFELLDTFQMPRGMNPYSREIRKNPSSNQWESFGTLLEEPSKHPLGMFYFSLNKNNFHFNQKRVFMSNLTRNWTFDFAWMNDTLGWFITKFGGDPIRVDTDFNIIPFTKKELSYSSNIMKCKGSGLHYQYEAIRYFVKKENESNKIIFLTNAPKDTTLPYSPCIYSLWEARIDKDSIMLLKRQALFRKNHFWPGIAPILTKDRKGNYIITGTDYFYYNTRENTLGIIKISPDFKHIWESTLHYKRVVMAALDVKADYNNNLVVVGQIKNGLRRYEEHGFFLKVFEDGSLNSTRTPEPGYDFSVSPNPASGSLFIRGTKGVKSAVFRLYDALGRPALNAKLTSSQVEISLERIPQGLYYWSISGNPGEPAQSGKLVVRR